MQQEKNLTNHSEFIWSDGWYVSENEAWFVTGEQDILFCLDRKTGNTNLAKELPERKKIFRAHPKCIKYRDTVFCLPDVGEDIWCYHIFADTWKKIIINNPKKVRIACTNSWIIKNKIYIVAIGLKQILEIDILKETVTSYYNLPIKNGEKVSGSILVGNWIYIIGVHPVCIYKFNCITKRIEVTQLFDINDMIHTISFDGEKFWLSGRCRKIYIWKEVTNEIIILDKFPNKFGIWNFSGKYKNLLNYDVDSIEMPLFLYSSFVGQYMWFIPAQSNEILYIDKNTYEIGVFHLENEELTEENIKIQPLAHKYLLEYISSGRYIGLFSLKNKQIIEIDTKELKYKILKYCIKTEHMFQIRKTVLDDKFYMTSPIFESDATKMNELLEYVKLRGLYNGFSYRKERKDISVGKEILVKL